MHCIQVEARQAKHNLTILLNEHSVNNDEDPLCPASMASKNGKQSLHGQVRHAAYPQARWSKQLEQPASFLLHP